MLPLHQLDQCEQQRLQQLYKQDYQRQTCGICQKTFPLRNQQFQWQQEQHQQDLQDLRTRYLWQQQQLQQQIEWQQQQIQWQQQQIQDL
ncbi:hypothetical protein C2857_001205 [Epichloe festucae Fl1]|uniref:Uncharacterized protein n=1 Tax=Epichloe festucae (strain Fl1) TaxID=877507 RepID=A0A7S9PWQ0_EPIFF|nr:hypothetical protein C2857_001205 [Epichloe festucae Fl1]